MLTRKQSELLTYLSDHMQQHDVPPSFDEMRDALGLASKSGVHRLVSGLEERGYIRRLANRARAIEILKPVTAAASGVVTRAVETASNLVSLPLLGRIAAGTPIEALSDPTNHLEIPASMIGSGEHFALEIVGDSMMGAGILDGDTVVIQRAETARHGEIVVALINQQEATLKTLLKEPGRVGLEAANPRYETRYFSTGEVEVQGKLAGLIRNY
ncbi:transcriptional repressor LexA [Alphaproteobacteria bacterium]|jgi:repressor LexA|nr:transcriptional repressor LexA [Alphaproteobacteria bacterium]MDA8872742.1 transcriptional repressor LexA [Alphaproteobacteria bacterium]MDA9012616.1 transcriptional repressor LexA [Alphaproteobacteria bacterium]MDA9132609.1 transcriptional repressor LexA [Alphaproteobacteria bacterium]MDG2489876.1 transcriptional repressor LexA [Alphaproteobacteria bacterium]